MNKFNYTKQEKEANKILKYNQNISQDMLNDTVISATRENADVNIVSSIELLKSLGFENNITIEKKLAEKNTVQTKIEHRPTIESWENILQEANEYIQEEVGLEDLLTPDEINTAYKEISKIDDDFSNKTSIINKTDLRFLAIATELQVAKSLLFPYIADKFDYGKSFDPNERLIHNDKNIENEHKEANNRFRDKQLKNHEKGYWINILYQTPPYDITKGAAALGINMGGKYHRLYTLGHDPILGWLFGTANILTDIITLNDFQSYRVIRKPTMAITPNKVDIGTMLYESYQIAKEDYLNLPAAIFAQASHLKSDIYTKVGLPVPLITIFNENFASNLYKNQYDLLCFARDTKIVGTSYTISLLIDIIIGLIHGLFRTENESQKLYEMRTRKILLISNTIASTSSILNATITKNPKNLDIGSLLSTLTHLFTDIRFMAKIKKEFIDNEIQKKLQKEFEEIDALYDSI